MYSGPGGRKKSPRQLNDAGFPYANCRRREVEPFLPGLIYIAAVRARVELCPPLRSRIS